MEKRKIKTPVTEKSNRINISETIDYDTKPPIFSLERVQNGDYCFSVLDKENKSQFAEAMFKRRALSWSQVKSQGRHALGFEKIAKDSIKTRLPPFIKDDFEYFLAFRFNGRKPMVGYRIKDVFYVLWFDHNFTLYDH